MKCSTPRIIRGATYNKRDIMSCTVQHECVFCGDHHSDGASCAYNECDGRHFAACKSCDLRFTPGEMMLIPERGIAGWGERQERLLAEIKQRLTSET